MRRLFLILLLAGSGVLGAQTEAPKPGKDSVLNVFIPIIENLSEARAGGQFQTPLISSAVNRFKKNGFKVITPLDKDGGKTAMYVADGYYVIEGDRLVFQISITHAATGRIVAADMVSTFAGLTSMDVINEMLDTIIKKTKAYSLVQEKNTGKAVPLPEPLIFKSSQEGVAVSWGGSEPFGTVVNGQVEAPFYPFPSDGTIVVRITKDGYVPRTAVFTLSEYAKELTLPLLTQEYNQEVFLSTGLGRWAGLGAAYRYFPVKNSVFLSVENHLYFQIPSSVGGKLVPHDDIWFTAGIYLFLPPESDFRMAVQMGGGWLFTPLGDKLYVDPALLPLSLLFEYRGWGIPAFLEMRVPYTLGGDGGLLGQQWLTVGDSFPMVSLGVAWRW